MFWRLQGMISIRQYTGLTPWDSTIRLATYSVLQLMKFPIKKLLGSKIIFGFSWYLEEWARYTNTFTLFHTILMPCKDETNQWLTCHGHQIPQLSIEQHNTLNISLAAFCFCYIAFSTSPTLSNSNFRTFLICILSTLMLIYSLEPPCIPRFIEQGSVIHPCYFPLPIQVNFFLRCLKIMMACIWDGPVIIDDWSLYNLWHFYVNEKRIGHFTCRIAFHCGPSMVVISAI